MRTIRTDELLDMVRICAELTRQSITFTCEQVGNTWII